MNLSLNSEELLKNANEVIAIAGNFGDQITALYTTIDEVEKNWRGSDASAYTEKVREQKVKLDSFKSELDDYAEKLKKVVGIYSDLESENVSSINGN